MSPAEFSPCWHYSTETRPCYHTYKAALEVLVQRQLITTLDTSRPRSLPDSILYPWLLPPQQSGAKSPLLLVPSVYVSDRRYELPQVTFLISS
jgi:hypothetical protein